MKISVKIAGSNASHVAKLPYEGADHVVVDVSHHKCNAPIRVRGKGIESTTHDTYTAIAQCLECGEPIGRINCTVSTIFGIEEDDRVLNGRCRVY